jgi:hypothetical protein
MLAVGAALAALAAIVTVALVAGKLLDRQPAPPDDLLARLRWTGCLRTTPGRCVRDAREPLRLLVPAGLDGSITLTRAPGDAVSLEYVGRLGDREVFAVGFEPRGVFQVELGVTPVGHLRIDDDDDQAALADVDALRTAGRFAEAIALADARLPSLTGRARVRALYTSGRTAFAAGDATEAAARFRRTADEAVALGLDDDAALGKLTAAFVLGTRLGKVADALAILGDGDVDGRSAFWTRVPQVRAHRLYYRAVTYMNAANHRKAIADLRESIDLHRVLGNDAEATGAAATLSSVYAALGRPEDALALVRETPRDALPKSGCTAHFFANNATFAALRAAERAAVPWNRDDDARGAALAEAKGWLDRLAGEPDDRCSDRAARSLTRVHAAELAWLGGDLEELARAVDEHRRSASASLPVVELAWRELELHLALARGARADAQRLAAPLLAEAESLEQPHGAWSAHMAIARAFGDRDAARARRALVEAERVLERTLADVAVGDGRNAFLSAHEASAAELVELLVRTGERDEAAATIARSARRAIASAARAFAPVGARSEDEARALDAYREVKARAEEAAASDWELPANEAKASRERRAREVADARRALEAAFAARHPLPSDSGAERPGGAPLSAPPAGEAELFVHPSRSGYVAVLRTPSGARAARVEGPIAKGERARAAASIARELVGSLPRGTRLHLVAYGPLRPLDWAAVAIDAAGTRLVEHVALVEHLGLGPADGASLPRNPESGSVVVADPTLDLPYAAREGAFVRERLGAASLVGSAATRSAVAGALEGSAFVHYAGHGRFAGADGFESELRLANGSALTVSDVLLLARAPRVAVLSGCELSRSDDASGESFGIAQALLARGARFAIAPSRKVPDALAERFVKALYADGALAEEAIVERFAEAMRALAREAPTDDWSTFRLLAQ